MRSRFVLSSIARFAVVLLLVTFAITAMVRLLPGDPITALFPFATEEQRIQYQKDFGLDRNVIAYYLDWLRNFVSGDFGFYYAASGDGQGVPVGDVLATALPRTLFLVLYTSLFSLVVSIPLGLFLAYRAETRTDKTIGNILFGLASIPNFALGLILAFLLGVQLNLLPVLGYVPIAESVGEHLKSMVMPVLSLSLGLIATFSRLLRVDTIATLKEDFVTMASSKGLSNTWILWRHVFRPSSSTLLTSAALNMAGLIGGAVVVETVFAINGFGTLLTVALATRQYLAIQSLVALVAVSYMLFNLIVDLLYAVVDPRVASHRGA
jgi:peptide/nickel transport system permease protein